MVEARKLHTPVQGNLLTAWPRHLVKNDAQWFSLLYSFPNLPTFSLPIFLISLLPFSRYSNNPFQVDCVWNVMAHAQKPDFVFQRHGRVHLNRQRRQFSRLLEAELCAWAVVMLDTPYSEVVWRVLATHSIRQFPPSLPLPCVTVCHHISIVLYSTRLVSLSQTFSSVLRSMR